MVTGGLAAGEIKNEQYDDALSVRLSSNEIKLLLEQRKDERKHPSCMEGKPKVLSTYESTHVDVFPFF